ncbi:MAG: ATP-binding protein, partial [Proteobacteria bacterium]|nr:ATP-binding protein [Pseudomonadota bacterium]
NQRSKFQTKTNWCVVTGAPSSGKTSVINELARRGFTVESEVARELIELGISKGRTLEQVRADAQGLQTGILEVALAREMELDPDKIVFLDRGLPDSITYFKLAGLDGMEALATSYLFQYCAVFIFDRLPLVKDDVRTEDGKLADQIDKNLEADYKSVGYTPVRVPVMPVTARADFILKKMAANGA